MKKTIDKILERVLIVIITIMLFSVIWQVFSRFILQSPSTITDELSSYLLIWLGLLGAAYATGQQLHLAIDLIPQKAIHKNPMLYEGIIHFSVLTFGFLVMIIGGTRLCWLTFIFGQKSAALQIPLGYVYLVVPISGVLISYYAMHIFLVKKNQ